MAKAYWIAAYRSIACHDSPGYRAALAALGDGAERDMRIVPGVQ